MANQKIYDAIVVGAGVEGSSTAYQLVKQGSDTLLIEQFLLPHSRGSSHGPSRITRKAYGVKDYYTEMMEESFRLLEELEKEAGEQLLVKTGCLVLGEPTNPFMSGTLEAFIRNKLPYERLTAREQRQRYPTLSYPDSYDFLLDKTGGVLKAEKILGALQSQFVKRGGTLKDGETFLEVTPGDVVTVKTNKGTYQGKSLVLTVGPWASDVLAKIGLYPPLETLRISVCYWKEKQTGKHSSSVFPTMIEVQGSGGEYDIYALPSEEYPGLVKVCIHHGPEMHPDRRDKDQVGDEWSVSRVQEYIKKHFIGLESTPSIIEPCIYTNTPDRNFILDLHPTWKNIVIGAGFSGHGFKLGPVVGKVLAQLATGKPVSYDLSRYRLDRFSSSSKL